MSKILIITLVLGLLLVGSVGFIQEYKIPMLIPEDYDCENHPGFFSDSNPAFFESSQHYINRKNDAIQKQLERVCN